MSALRCVDGLIYVEKSRHLFRYLLRETTYLPDSRCREFSRQYVAKRFRTISMRNGADLERVQVAAATARRSAIESKIQLDFRKGFKALYQLVRANEGDPVPLRRILRHTYGRNGPRRYELMESLLRPDDAHANTTHVTPPSVSRPTLRWDITTVTTPDIVEAPTNATGDTAVYKIASRFSRLKALVASQLRTRVDSQRPKLPAKISIPTKNAWGRSMPRVRVRNMVRRQCAQLLDAVLPPLPIGEWQRLRDMSSGKRLWDGPIARRKRLVKTPDFMAPSDLEKLVHSIHESDEQIYLDSFIQLESRHTKKTTKISKILDAAGDDGLKRYWRAEDAWLTNDNALVGAVDAALEDEIGLRRLNKRLSYQSRGHVITPKFMRRLWSEIFQTCPMMSRDEEDKPWQVTWGQAPNRREQLAELEELFGINEASTKATGTST